MANNLIRKSYSRTARPALWAVLLVASLCVTASAQSTPVTTTTASGTTPTGLAPGAPAGSYALSGFEDINLFNGNLNLHFPLLGVGGRGGARVQLVKNFDIKNRWRIDHQEVENVSTGQLNDIYTLKTGGWSPEPKYTPGVLYGRPTGNDPILSCGSTRYIYLQTLTRLTFVTADGTEHELRDRQTGGQVQPVVDKCNPDGFNRGTEFISADGSNLTFTSDSPIFDKTRAVPATTTNPSGYLLTPDGMRYRIDGGQVSWIRDRNGNVIKFEMSTGAGGLSVLTVTDSLNRTVTVTYDKPDVSPYVSYDEIAYRGFGGAPRTIRVRKAAMGSALRPERRDEPAERYQLRTLQQLFPQLRVVNNFTWEPLVVKAIELPDQRNYFFYYNSYGEVARVELPTGGAFEYDYTPGSGASTQGEGSIYRRLVARRVYADGTTEANRTTYSTAFDAAEGGDVVTVEQFDPADLLTPRVREKHYYRGTADAEGGGAATYPTWNEGREFKTEVYDPAGAAEAPPLRKVENTWEQGAVVSPWSNAVANNPRVSQTMTTVADLSPSLVTKQTFSFDADPTLTYNLQTRACDYDYGQGGAGELLRCSHTTYEKSLAYTGASVHLRGLPLRQWMSTDLAGEDVVALTIYGYDQSGLTNRPGITGLCTYYPNGVCSETGPAGEALTTYVTRGNVTTTTSYANADAETGAVASSAIYDIAGNVVSTTDANNNVSQIGYPDSFCNDGGGCGTAGYVPNTFAFPTSAKSPKPDPSGTYGSAVELTTSTVYDFYTGLAYSSTDANNRTMRMEYADPLDRPTAQVRPDGSRTDIYYSQPNEPLYVRTLADLDGGRRTESRQYFDKLGRPARSFTWENQDAGNPWLAVDMLYDALGRAWRTSNPYRSTGPGSDVDVSRSGVETTFDALGRVRQMKTTADGAVVKTDYSGDRVLVTDQAGRQRISKTDALGRLREVWEVTPDDSTKYPGVGLIPTAITTGLLDSAYGYGTEYFYDAAGNLRRVKQGTQQRFFAYDSLGRLVRAKNPEQGTFAPDTAAGFPALTDLVSGNGQWSMGYIYDTNGNLTKRRDARGVTTSYGYDGLNRNTLVHYDDAALGAANHTPDIIRSYDGAILGKGQPWKTETADLSLTVVDGYDEAGRPKQQTQKFWTGSSWEQARAYVIGLEYNLGGGITKLTYPSGNAVTYSYDAAGRLGDNGTQPAFKGTLGDGVERTYASQLNYGELGGLREERFGTETPLYHKLHYNSRGQLFDIRLSTQSLAANEWDWNRGAILNYYGGNYAWEGDPNTPTSADNNGNLRRAEVYVPLDPAGVYNATAIGAHYTAQQTYSYDSLNRLTQVEEASGGQTRWAQAYDYDRWGNRTINAAATQVFGQNPGYAVPEPQFAVDTDTNRLGVPVGQPGMMNYDAAGNLINDSYSPQSYGSQTGQQTRFYDAENRMTSAQTGAAQTAVYVYDADGRRVKRLVGGAGEVWQVYGAGGALLAEYAKDAPHTQPRKEYGYRGGELLVMAEAAAAGWGPPPAFTGPDPLSKGDSIMLEHLTELRSAVNQLRQQAGLSPYNFTVDPNPESKVTSVKAEHIRQLRLALEGAQSRLGLPTGVYKHSVLEENFSLIYAIDFQELRDQIRGAWQGGSGGVVVHWLVGDQLGTPRMVLDRTGSLTGVSRYDYLPFGEELSASISGRTATQGYSAVDNVRQRFTGYERDEETKLDYAQARYYANVQGRFTGVDPLTASAGPAQPQSWNRYAYCLNNPLAYVDPTGLIWGERDLGNGTTELKWFKDQKELDAAGSAWSATTNFLRRDPNGGWFALNRFEGTYDHLSDRAVAATLLNGGAAYRMLGFKSALYMPLERFGNAVDDVMRSEQMQTVFRDPGVQGALWALALLGMSNPLAPAVTTAAEGSAGIGLSRVQQNKLVGDAFRDEVADTLQAAGRDVELEVVKKTPFGVRRIDIEVSHNGRVLGGIETKTGGSRYYASQRAKDYWLRMFQDYPVNVVRDK